MADTPERSDSADALGLARYVEEPMALDELDDPAEVVEEFPFQGFVTAARRLEDEGRLDLVLPHATPEQLTCLLDLDAWTRERVNVPRARTWLLAIAEAYIHADKPRGALVDLIYRMDPEMWTLALAAGTEVIVLDPEDDGSRHLAFEELGHLRTWETPDGFFVVGVPDDEFGQQVLATLNYVYADDLSEGRKLTLSLQSVLPSSVEEDLLRWRSGRLADLGFVSWEEAMKLFRPLDPKAAAAQEARDFAYLSRDAELGSAVMPWTAGTELLREVMHRLPDAQHGLRAREFLLLVNEVMAAQRFPPGHDKFQERAIDQTQATITLGLELLVSAAPGQPDPVEFLSERLRAIGLRDVFRVGYGALDKLRRAATSLHQGARVSLTSPGSLLDRPWGPAIAAFARWYPELPISATSEKTRPMRGLQDVARATQLVGQAGALARLAFEPEGFGIDAVWMARVDEPERLLLGDLVRSAIVHAHLPGSRTTMAPLTPDDLAWARTNLLTTTGLVPDVAKDLSARCDALGIGAHTEVLAENILTRMQVELAGLEVDAHGKPDLTKAGGFLTIQSVSMWLTTATGDAN